LGQTLLPFGEIKLSGAAKKVHIGNIIFFIFEELIDFLERKLRLLLRRSSDFGWHYLIRRRGNMSTWKN